MTGRKAQREDASDADSDADGYTIVDIVDGCEEDAKQDLQYLSEEENACRNVDEVFSCCIHNTEIVNDTSKVRMKKIEK